ncbi:MAG: hypothetical protein HY821_11120 [Acidobacteria bacterium]|nr:hypothetical protein [Acidobacteriota bacterium]
MNAILALAAAGFALAPVWAQGTASRPVPAAAPAAVHSPYGEVPALSLPVPPRPVAGAVAILPISQVKPGMKGVAWTVFQGTEPEAVPVEIIGRWENNWGPRQDTILAKLGGKAAKTNVAGGMSGSPVYIDGKLIGAIALRISVFSPDAICGITPIEQMLEINSIDASRPASPKTPQVALFEKPEIPVPASLLAGGATLTPIETPLALAGFHESTLREFQPYFEQMGIAAVRGGAGGALRSTTPAPGWQSSLKPGEAIAGVLVSGDMSITGLGTVTYNDGKRVLGFGHSFFNLGPVSMPMAKGEVLMVLSSQFQPNKFANTKEIVGALRQDRHSGIMGELGAVAETIPVSLKLRSEPAPGFPTGEREYRFNVFVHPKWTPFLMLLTTYNTLQDLNSTAADDATYFLRGRVELEGAPPLEISTRVVSGESPMPAAMQVGAWWADKFSRLFQNQRAVPAIKRVDVTLEMSSSRKIAVIENAWLDQTDVAPGARLSGKVALRPFRGDRIVRPFQITLPANLPPGEHRLFVGDSTAVNRASTMAVMLQRDLDIPQTVQLLNQEKPNDRLYVALIEPRPTVYDDDHALRGVPASVLNVMQSSSPGRPMPGMPESVRVLDESSLGQIVSGATTLRFKVR